MKTPMRAVRFSNISAAHARPASFLLGSLAVLALPPFYHWYVLFLSFSGFLWLLQNSPSKKRAFAVGWWFGFGFFAFGLSWINNALLVNPEQTGWLIPIVFVASGAFFGLFTGIPALLAFLVSPPAARFVALSAWLVVFEWIRSWILTGFPWNLWGSCLAFNLELIQTASVLGTYGLSLAVIMTASAPALALLYRTRRAAVISAGIVVLIPALLYGFGRWRLAELPDTQAGGVKIRLVQPSIPQNLKWSPELKQQNFEKYIAMSAEKPLDGIAMVIWGETASPYPLDRDDDARRAVLEAIGGNSRLATGLVRFEDDYYGGWRPLNSSLIISPKGIIEDSYDKSHLVPFGEYIPLRRYLPDAVRPITNTISDFKAGNGPKVITLPGIPPFGIQICYEIIFPHQIIDSTHKPDWLINLTNDGWYGLSAGPYQHLVSTRLRAVEEGLTIVRSANSGISALIDLRGQVLHKLDLHQEGILDVALPQRLQIPTIYNSYGNGLILTLCFINMLIAAFIHRKQK